jgi:signal transduction histidine kinase
VSLEGQSAVGSDTRRMTTILIGIMLSIVFIAWAAAGLPGTPVIRWLALLPATAGLLCAGLGRNAGLEASLASELQQANDTLRRQVNDLTKLRDMMLTLGATFDRATILDEITGTITQTLHMERGLVLLVDGDKNALVFGATTHPAEDPENQFMLEQLQVDLNEIEDDPLLQPWLEGQPVLVTSVTPYLSSRLNWLLTTMDLGTFYSVPLRIGTRTTGVIIVDNKFTNQPNSQEQQSLMQALAANIAITLENARLYQLTDEQLTAKVEELHILNRIDRELNHALSVERVLNLTLDWALRFTPSNTVAVALVEPEENRLRFVTGYGYAPEQWEQIQHARWPLGAGISGRVAQRGKPENIADVSQDADYIEIMPGTRSQLSVPVIREDRVVAVISLESQQPDAFDATNIDFLNRLAARAGVAIDNARLFDETLRERQKLETILSSTADAVIVAGPEGDLILINQAALSALRLSPKDTYVGQPFTEVFGQSPLRRPYDRACSIQEGLVEEVTLSDHRTFHVSIVPAPQVGWTIVMHDVTPFKETDRLKNELLATTSHDLKNPLGSILGYVDLVTMTNALNPQGMEYVRRVQRAVTQMRQLIDDLLDMAKIESGITLSLSQLELQPVLNQILEALALQIKEKEMTVKVEVPPELCVRADENRLTQIINNLVTNALKYTPPEGHITIRAEKRDNFVQVAVEDDGLGISPENQAQVFARFFRVRTPETDSIEGTGLGLAIVKSLVEAHGGQVGLKSRLGEGTTFYFTIPSHTHQQQAAEQADHGAA